MKTISNQIALLISIFFPPEFGGGATGAYNRAAVLNRLGYKVYILCGFPQYPSGKVPEYYRGKLSSLEKMGDLEIIRLRLLPLSHTSLINRFIIFLNFIIVAVFCIPWVMARTGRIDIVYARAPILFSFFAGFLYSKLSRAFFIYEAPDLWPEELVIIKSKLAPLIYCVGKFMASISYNNSDVVITISEKAAYYIKKTYRPSVPVYGIPTGVDTSKFQVISKIDARKRLANKNIIPENIIERFIILYTGLLSEAQGVESLLYASEKIKSNRDVAFVIVGDGPQKERILDLKNKLGLDNTILISHQPRSVMPEIISSADLCCVVLSSQPIFGIALPTKFYEYLACHKPLLGICHGELAKMIEKYQIGLVSGYEISEISKAIQTMISSPTLLGEFEENCKDALSSFSLDAIGVEFKDVLNHRKVISYIK